jgi:hypothetical protein
MDMFERANLPVTHLSVPTPGKRYAGFALFVMLLHACSRVLPRHGRAIRSCCCTPVVCFVRYLARQLEWS